MFYIKFIIEIVYHYNCDLKNHNTYLQKNHHLKFKAKTNPGKSHGVFTL